MPASVEGSLNEAYLAPNTFLNKRDVRKKIFPRYNEQNLFDWAQFTGRTKETDNTRFNWFEKGYLYGYGEVLSSSATAYTAGTKVTIVLKTASHQESGTKSAGKKWDSVMIAGVRGWVQATNKGTPNAHTYTIKPVKSTDNITGGSLNALANAFVVFYSTAAADGTSQPESMVNKPDLFYNYTQIIKTKYEVFGSASANKTEVQVGGKPFYYLEGVQDSANKHKLDIMFAMFFGERYDGSLTDDDASAEPVYTTGGIDATIRDFGNVTTYTTFDFAKLQAIEKILSKERAPMEMMWLNGVNLDMEIDNVVKGKLDNNGMNYAAFGKANAQERAVDFGYDSFRFSKRTYHKKAEDFLNYAPVTGYTAAPWPDNGYILPIDRIANPKPSGSGGDEEMDTVCLRYKRNDKESRFEKHWTRDINVTNVDRLEFNHMSECGLQFACLNQAIKISK